MFSKKGALKSFAKFTRKYPCRSLFYDKVAGHQGATLLKKRLRKVFSREFWEIFKNAFSIGHLCWLLLKKYDKHLFLKKFKTQTKQYHRWMHLQAIPRMELTKHEHCGSSHRRCSMKKAVLNPIVPGVHMRGQKLFAYWLCASRDSQKIHADILKVHILRELGAVNPHSTFSKMAANQKSNVR